MLAKVVAIVRMGSIKMPVKVVATALTAPTKSLRNRTLDFL